MESQTPEQSFTPDYRLMTQKDGVEVLTLMLQSEFPVSGLVSRSLYSALCQDALTGSDVHIAVAGVENQIAAFLLAITDWSAYWRRFVLRHPFLGLQIVRQRRGKRNQNDEDENGDSAAVWRQLSPEDREYLESIMSASPSGKSWSDSSPTIAKGVFLQVDPQFRGRGLSVGLYLFLMNHLANCGVTRIDARVDLTNRRAMPLHVSVGYRLELSGRSLFATKDLSK